MESKYNIFVDAIINKIVPSNNLYMKDGFDIYLADTYLLEIKYNNASYFIEFEQIKEKFYWLLYINSKTKFEIPIEDFYKVLLIIKDLEKILND